MTEQQFNQIIEWQNETFPNATSLSKATHLLEEVKELRYDLMCDSPEKKYEFADCFTLLFGSAAADGMSYQDICNAIDEKMEINRKRKWGKPDKNGVVHHIK